MLTHHFGPSELRVPVNHLHAAGLAVLPAERLLRRGGVARPVKPWEETRFVDPKRLLFCEYFRQMSIILFYEKISDI